MIERIILRQSDDGLWNMNSELRELIIKAKLFKLEEGIPSDPFVLTKSLVEVITQNYGHLLKKYDLMIKKATDAIVDPDADQQQFYDPNKLMESLESFKVFNFKVNSVLDPKLLIFSALTITAIDKKTKTPIIKFSKDPRPYINLLETNLSKAYAQFKSRPIMLYDTDGFSDMGNETSPSV